MSTWADLCGKYFAPSANLTITDEGPVRAARLLVPGVAEGQGPGLRGAAWVGCSGLSLMGKIS